MLGQHTGQWDHRGIDEGPSRGSQDEGKPVLHCPLVTTVDSKVFFPHGFLFGVMN